MLSNKKGIKIKSLGWIKGLQTRSKENQFKDIKAEKHTNIFVKDISRNQ